MKKAFPFDYMQVEAVVSRYVANWRQKNFDAVVAVARGGLVPATMAATALDLPLHALFYQRQAREVSWFTQQKPQAGSKVLLVEDIAGRGTTLSDCVAFLDKQGFKFEVFTLAYDDESRLKPNYGVEMPSLSRAWFPWEREAITPAFSQTNNQPSRPEYEYASWAIDLDGILLPDIPDADYLSNLEQALQRRDQLQPFAVLPQVDVRNFPIITGRPEQDRERTQRWLDQHGFAGQLTMRDPVRYTVEQTAQYKAETVLQQGHTHFIESDAVQALEIASRVQVARVIWWDGSRALAVFANSVDHLSDF